MRNIGQRLDERQKAIEIERQIRRRISSKCEGEKGTIPLKKLIRRRDQYLVKFGDAREDVYINVLKFKRGYCIWIMAQ